MSTTNSSWQYRPKGIRVQDMLLLLDGEDAAYGRDLITLQREAENAGPPRDVTVTDESSRVPPYFP